MDIESVERKKKKSSFNWFFFLTFFFLLSAEPFICVILLNLDKEEGEAQQVK